MLADIIDDDANKTGYRRPGIYFAVWGTTSKLTFAFAIVIAFSLLGMEIFEPSEENILVDTNWLIILYALLPPIFNQFGKEELEHFISGLDTISDGGAALTAYSKLQFVDMSEKEH